MKYRSICSVASKSAITPSLSGRIAVMLSGVRPIIRFASWPTARISPVVRVHRDDGRLVEQHALAADVDERVGGAEVNGHVAADDAVRHAAPLSLARACRKGPLDPCEKPKSAGRFTSAGHAAEHVVGHGGAVGVGRGRLGAASVVRTRYDAGPATGRDVRLVVDRAAGAGLDRRLEQRQREHPGGGELLAGGRAQRRRPAGDHVVDEQRQRPAHARPAPSRPAGRPTTTADR